MKTENNQKQYCKKIAKRSKDLYNPTILIGLIIKDEPDYIIFKTRYKEYYINRSELLSIESTNIEFEEAEPYKNEK